MIKVVGKSFRPGLREFFSAKFKLNWPLSVIFCELNDSNPFPSHKTCEIIKIFLKLCNQEQIHFDSLPVSSRPFFNGRGVYFIPLTIPKGLN